jgi:hypothetical protein
MNNLLLAIVLFLLSFVSCQDEQILNQVACEQPVKISKTDYQNVPDEHIDINSIKLNNNCLTINFSASGCSGNSWVPELIDAGDVMESQPPRRNLVFALHNQEMCAAYFTKEISFDVSTLQVSGNSVYLILQNTGEEILYTY